MGKPTRGASLEMKIRSSVLKMTSEGAEMPIEHMSLNFRMGTQLEIEIYQTAAYR